MMEKYFAVVNYFLLAFILIKVNKILDLVIEKDREKSDSRRKPQISKPTYRRKVGLKRVSR